MRYVTVALFLHAGSQMYWIIITILEKNCPFNILPFLPCVLTVCVLLCARQRSASANVWQGTCSGQLFVTLDLPGSSICPRTTPASPRSQHDAATDLSHAEADETGQQKRGCCQVRNTTSLRNN